MSFRISDDKVGLELPGSSPLDAMPCEDFKGIGIFYLVTLEVGNRKAAL